MGYNDSLESISEYLKYHDMLDEFVWLLRLMYAPKHIIKNKKYKVSELYQYYLKENIKIDKISRNIYSKKANNKDKFIYYLKQGWYNELAATYPFNPLHDDLSTNIGDVSWDKSWRTELFPSWEIVKSYYSMYSFYNGLLFTNYANADTYNHRNMTNNFNTTLLNKFSKYVVFFPFNMIFDGSDKNLSNFRSRDRDEWKYQYSLYPRSKYYFEETPMPDTDMSEQEIMELLRERYEARKSKTFYDLESSYYSNLVYARNTLKCKAPVNIIDIMYLFRTWANYSGSDTVCQLQKGGYLRYLEKNLYAINYFIAGITEITAICYLGPDLYLSTFNDF